MGKCKSAAAVILVVLTFIFCLFFQGQEAGAETQAGQVIGEYRGVQAFSRGDFDPLDAPLQYQCVAYAKRFYATHFSSLGGIHDVLWGTARDFWESTHETLIKRYNDGSHVKPKRGDMIFFDVAWTGHVAIVMDVSEQHVRIIQQNWDRDSAYGEIELGKNPDDTYHVGGQKWPGTETYYAVLGWLSPIATLTNGTGDGSVTVTVDPYGTFGTYTAFGWRVGGSTTYDPIGPLPPSSTVYQSSVYLGLLYSGDSSGGVYLHEHDENPYLPGSLVTGGEFTSILSKKEARSEFSVQRFNFELIQTLNDKGPQGSTFTQTYRITNNTGNTQSFDLIRHVDGDLYFDGTLIDSGGASADGLMIFEFDSGDDPTNPSTFVGITNQGGDDVGFHIGYTIEPYRFTDDIIVLGAAVLDNTITGDSNGDNVIENPYDVTLSLGNRFENIAAGQTVTFTTKTIFGSGSPIVRAALPSGFVPAQESHDTINETETHWYDFFNDTIRDIWVILGFGSEFNLRVYQPDGTLYQEEQSDVSPIEVFIPNAQLGQWRFEVSALQVPYPNDPYVLAIGVPSCEADTTPPTVSVTIPSAGYALQDGFTFTATASDDCGIDEVYFYLREPGGSGGIPIGHENLPGTLNASGNWEYDFDTTQLEDGYYVVIAKAIDTNDNEGWSELVPFSIRNWAVVELLPASEKNKAGRTMPVKFALRIAAVVDPAQPFVYNQELEIRIYDASEPGTILQTSLYGDTSTDYRINTVAELYITNFKTMKQPATYVVEVWRMSKNFQVGSFSFKTVK